MKLKQKIEDFRVRELLEWDAEGDHGSHRVYRVTKRKLTSIEAASELAREAGVHPQAVSMAGLKDRQGVTIQHMSIERGSVVSLKRPDLRIETLGRVPNPITSAASNGNAFQIVVRGLDGDQLRALRAGMTTVRRDGLINYFDEQRFGNLRHGQGWIMLDLIRGDVENALKTLLTARSFHDDKRNSEFKRRLRDAWGDWHTCRDVAGQFGSHHSVFEQLKSEPEDFVGAFGRVATRLRLIHLYAFQSHLWNRGVAELVREATPIDERIVVKGPEGPLVFPGGPLDVAPTFRLPAERLEGCTERERELLADALAAHGIVASALEVDGVPGFGLKGEDRQTIIRPQHLRVRPAEPDEENRGFRKVRVRFELPRGAYATLLIRRLLARPLGERGEEQELRPEPRRDDRNDRGPRREGHRGGGHRESAGAREPSYFASGGDRPRGERREGARGGYGGQGGSGGGYRGGRDGGGDSGHRGGQGGYGGHGGQGGGGYRGGRDGGRDSGYRGGQGGHGGQGGGGGYRGGRDGGRDSGYRGGQGGYGGQGGGGGYRGGRDGGQGSGYRGGQGGPGGQGGGGGYRGGRDGGQGSGYRGGQGGPGGQGGGGGYRGGRDGGQGSGYRGGQGGYGGQGGGGGYRGGRDGGRDSGYRGGQGGYGGQGGGGYRGGRDGGQGSGYRGGQGGQGGQGDHGRHGGQGGGGYRGGRDGGRDSGYRGGQGGYGGQGGGGGYRGGRDGGRDSGYRGGPGGRDPGDRDPGDRGRSRYDRADSRDGKPSGERAPRGDDRPQGETKMES